MAEEKKCRCWWFVQKIKHLPEDWRSQLAELMIPGAYIVHDRCFKTDEETGETVPKDPHIHCILEFGNAVRAQTVLNALPDSFGVLFCKPVPNKIGAYRYLMHLDQPEKVQYRLDEITDMSGFKVSVSAALNVGFTDLFTFITENQITSFSALLAVLVNDRPEYLDYVTAHVNLVKSFMTDYARSVL